MNKEPDLDQYNVRAVERAIQILMSFDDGHPERGVTEIAQATGLHKATVHRIIMTLLQHGLLERYSGGREVPPGSAHGESGAEGAASIWTFPGLPVRIWSSW